MSLIVSRMLRTAQPAVSAARPRDAAAISALHAACFRRGWGEDEVYALLADKAVVAHRTMIRRVVLGLSMAGFIISRRAADEAEILSVAIAPACRGRGFSRALLNFHLRTLAGLGTRAIFLEVDGQNAPALRLYHGAGFRDVGRRQGYFEGGATALILRRDLG